MLGYQMYTVLSGSMSPAIETGSIAVVKPVAPESIQVGDVITSMVEAAASPPIA